MTDCVLREVDATRNEALVWAALTKGNWSSSTLQRTQENALLTAFIRGGDPALYDWIVHDTGYQDECHLFTGVALATPPPASPAALAPWLGFRPAPVAPPQFNCTTVGGTSPGFIGPNQVIGGNRAIFSAQEPTASMYLEVLNCAVSGAPLQVRWDFFDPYGTLSGRVNSSVPIGKWAVYGVGATMKIYQGEGQARPGDWHVIVFLNNWEYGTYWVRIQ